MNTLEKKLLPIARKWAGNIPTWEVRHAGIDPSAVRHWAQNNPNVRSGGRGVYTWFCDDPQIDWENNEAARLVSQAGDGAYLWGPTALEFMEIGDVGQNYYDIAVPTRRRPRAGVTWIVERNGSWMLYNGIPTQRPMEAAKAAMPLMEYDKRLSVIDDMLRRFPEYTEELNALEHEYAR